MFAAFCLLFLLGLGHCQDNDLPTRTEVESSINRTIEEVERQVRADPSLPRLTRHEIVGILRNITSRELNVYKDKEQLEEARNLYQRALMVVLPYNVDESSENLNDLYTKPPMTEMIGDHAKSVKDASSREKNVERTASSATETITSSRPRYKTTAKESTTTRNRYKNHRETYSEVRTKAPLKETLKLDSTPVRFSFNLEDLQRTGQNVGKSTTARYPVYKSNGDLEIVYSSSVTDEPTTKPTTNEISVDPQKPEQSQNVLLSSQWRYNAPPSTTMKIPFLPTVNAEPEDRPAAQVQGSEISTKNANPDNVVDAIALKPTALYVTPMPTDGSSKIKHDSTYSLNSAGFRRATSTTSMPMRPEVMGLLASIGLRPENGTNVEDVYKKPEDAPRTEAAPTAESDSVRGPVSGSASVGSKSPGSVIRKGVENLTPDVQLLFQRFGLRTSLFDPLATTTTRRPAINLNSYTNFKPLPTSSVKDAEFKRFLARFGLGVADGRRQKSLKGSTEPPSLVEAVPNDMRGILENIGLISDSKKRARIPAKTALDTDSTDTSKFHVFKPHEVRVQDEEQRNKINELLDTVKLVQQGKADARNVKKVADDLLNTIGTLKDGPDPLKLEEIVKSYEEDSRNEVKRQEETTTTEEVPATSTAAGTESTETSVSTPATDSARAAGDQSTAVTGASPVDLPATTVSTTSTTASNLMALEESFGGTTRAPDPVLPPKRKTGLYFLVDWNTFLEVGEDEKEKVNLRFQPKVGDRSRFLPVTVP